MGYSGGQFFPKKRMEYLQRGIRGSFHTGGYSKMPHAALSSSQATIQVPMRFFTNFHATLASFRAFYRASHDFGKLPRNLVKLPCLMSRSCAVLPSLHATLASSRAVLPASLIDLAPAAVKFLLRPCHAVFAIFCAHRTKPPLVEAIGFSPLCRHFDDALSPL